MSANAQRIESRPLNGAAAVAVAAGTILLSSMLLFSVQPMISKALLPAFGGTASVWSEALLFFQAVLLLGYAYAHLLTRLLRPWAQAFTHIGMLAITLAVLPLAPRGEWRRIAADNPGWGLFVALLFSAGLPYFVLSATSPLVQAWFARTAPEGLPYRLYSVSNLGSLAALLAYPVLIEPNAGTRAQLLAWSAAYVCFILLCAAAAVLLGGRGETSPARGRAHDGVPAGSFLHWLALAAAGSMMLLTASNFLSQDIAPVPFLWVVPLALYLLSFVLCFDHQGWYRKRWFNVLLPLALLALVFFFFVPWHTLAGIAAVPAAAFVVFMFCHGELALHKPQAAHLTAFYLALSAGGALGGAFVAVAAPALFSGMVEYIAAPVLAALLGLHAVYGRRSRWLLATLGAVAAVLVVLSGRVLAPRGTVAVDRNFYGVVRVSEDDVSRKLVNGRVTHGLQFTDERGHLPTTYYGPATGAGISINAFPPGSRRIGVVGLGVATVAAYGRPGDTFRFYEINPLVIDFARRYFTFLADCPARTEIVQGDARLALEDEHPQGFDVLILDAFSGDAIPVHLLTREAVRVYRRHLQPGGVLAFHITNAYLDLAPMVGALLREQGMRTALISGRAEPDKGILRSDWVLGAAGREFMSLLSAGQARPVPVRQSVRVWTDDYSNLLRLLK